MPQSENEFVFLPLGGSGEIGMNLNMFGYGPEDNRQWIIVDIGVTFGGPDTPGIDIIMPDTEYIEEHVDKLHAIVLTHAHEDHMGALARLWPRLKCPVYATPFTMYLVKDRLSEFGLLDEVELHTLPLGSQFTIGPFDLEYVTLTHSIPEPNGLLVKTDIGTVFHTGDWKIDPDPQIGNETNIARLEAVRDAGVLAMICDSTNAISPGRAGSEGNVRAELIKLIGEYKGRGVAVASFASNVARMESVMMAAKAHNRVICLVGRSMLRMAGAAKSVGLLEGVPAFVSQEEAASLPQEYVLYLCTGSQGEPRAALSRIARDDHRHINFKDGDVVIFSSKIIPGNEKSIFDLQNNLAAAGVEIVTEKDRPIHVSGHPYQDELADMYRWVGPHISIPVHGERRHLMEHARLAKSYGVKHAHAPANGEMIKFDPDKGPVIVDIVPSGRLHQDGKDIVRADDEGLRLRRKMAYAGHASASLVYDKSGKIISGPEVRLSGFPCGDEGELLDSLTEYVADSVEDSFKKMNRKKLSVEEDVELELARVIKRTLKSETTKRAVVDVVVHRVG